MLGNDPTIVNDKWHSIQKFAARRAENAFPGVRLKRCSVRRAEDITLVLSEKLVFYPVHRHGNMATAVDVSEEPPLIIHHEAFNLAAIDQEIEFLGFTRWQLADAGNLNRWRLEQHNVLLFPFNLPVL